MLSQPERTTSRAPVLVLNCSQSTLPLAARRSPTTPFKANSCKRRSASASCSPNFRASKRSGSKEWRAVGATDSSERVRFALGKSQAHESRMGGLRGSGADVYLPGASTFQAPAPLKNLLKEHTQLKSHQTKKWLK